jgi:nucleoside-diphosphate-sugar epimerase
MKFLITGGAGFIGSNIVEELVARKHFVRVLDNFSTGKMENLEPFRDKIEVVKGDITNPADLRGALNGIEVVLHQAALRSVPRSIDDPFSSNEVNITGTLKLLLEAREQKIRRVVYASSSSVYGDSKKIPQNEADATSPISPYAVSKLAAENYCSVFAKTLGLQTVSLRYFNVFGPRQNPDSKYSAVIPKFIESATKSLPLEIHGDGEQSRDFTFIRNVVNANILAGTTEGVSGNVFNIACGKSYSVLDIARGIEKILAKKLEYNFLPARSGDVRATRADITKAGKLLSYAPEIGFEEGLLRTVDWFRSAFK